jgi:hypothetical protein
MIINMLETLEKSIKQLIIKGFFNGRNHLPEFQEPTPPNRKQCENPSYEERISEYVGRYFTMGLGFKRNIQLTQSNTLPKIPFPKLKIGIIRLIEVGKTKGIPYLSYTQGRVTDYEGFIYGVIQDYVKFGHCYICEPSYLPIDKILIDYAEVMGKLESVKCTGCFYHVMIISDPIKTSDKAAHLINEHGIKEYMKDRSKVQEIKLNEIKDEIQRVFNNVNPCLAIMDDIYIDWPTKNPQLKTHFIIIGPLFIEDKHKIWKNARGSNFYSDYSKTNSHSKSYLDFFQG